MLTDLLATDGVREVCELRSRFGFLAIHGGALERVTDVVAAEAAERADASFYGVLHPEHVDWHLPSIDFDPDHSARLAEFLDHCDVVVSIHGYGRQEMAWSLLLGGRNRELADHVGARLRARLPAYDVVSDLDRIPRALAGQHDDNPVNRPRHGGVQIELPPLVRWDWGAWGWSDHGEVGRAAATEALIRALADAALAWPQRCETGR